MHLGLVKCKFQYIFLLFSNHEISIHVHWFDEGIILVIIGYFSWNINVFKTSVIILVITSVIILVITDILSNHW